ncbi:helix-turn-helix transcriptional regulator [Rhodanobacter sp. C01]|uniref:helix-turn-helix domain-containing protein n=1 Tax=Rhodanobacter sp. C01 TaxID=1945856 RepID=UPI0009855BCE|nr:helix-turn-helix transcriptional regulator [Rhodanobacter sp. C01]OOG49657.1 transcriptional regulator [Rhodanobacter sp. C01]
MNAQKNTLSTAGGTFSDRIKLLIQRVGSATEIARMCGFSEGVVRSWRDGNTDPSRARCVTLARTLGISLVWLVAGEGTLQIDPNVPTLDDQYSSESVTSHRPRARLGMQGAAHAHHVENSGVDAQRLNTAMRILQSELSLAGSQLSLSENTDLLTQLYEILGPGGSHVDPLAMVTFNHRLVERIRQDRSTA